MGQAVDVDVNELLEWLGYNLVSVELASRRIVHASPRAAALMGASTESLVGQHLTDAGAAQLVAALADDPALAARVVTMLSAPVGSHDSVEYLFTRGDAPQWRRLSMRVVDSARGPRLDVIGREVDELVEARRGREVAVVLRELTAAVHAAEDLAAASRTIVERVRTFLRLDRCALMILDRSTGQLQVRTVSGPDEAVVSDDVQRGLDAMIDRFGLVHQFEDLTELGPDGAARVASMGLSSIGYAVVGSERDRLGVVTVGSAVRRRLTEHELGFVRDVADRLAGPLAQKVLDDERRSAAATLAAVTQRLQGALESSGIGVWEWDLASGVTTGDARCLQLWELPEGADLSLDVRARVHPDDQVVMNRTLARTVEPSSDGSYQVEYRYQAPSGTKHLMARGRIQRDATGRAVRFLGTLQDVSEARRLEAKLLAAQKLESLGVLAGGIAHDFNNLLVGVLGNAGLAKLELPPASPVLESIEGIETAALRASELTRQLLAYAGKGRFVISSIHLERLVQEMAHLLTAVIGKGVVLRYQFAHGLPPVRGDATQLRQVVMNLITNASDAIGERSGIITVATSLVAADRELLDGTLFDDELEPGDYVCLQVSDTGVGMDLETRARIFEPFFTTKFTGRGLGLAAVQGILRAHRGALKVYSEPGRGTTFKLLLPAGEGPADVEARAHASRHAPASGVVLVIDDEEAMRNVTRRILTSAGFSVLTAADGVDGVEEYRTRRAEIDLVILDVTMPRMGGEEAFRLLRQIDPAVRVLLASGYSEHEATAQFAGKGLVGFVEKPFQAAVLLDKVRAALRG